MANYFERRTFWEFLKDNIYYVIVGVTLLAVIAIISIAVFDKPAQVNAPLEPVNSNATQYVLPLSTFTILKDYSSDELLYNATLKRWESHKSIDLSASEGDEVFSVASGQVKNVYSNYLDGTVVVISHANGLESFYGSLKSTDVKVGDAVSQGQKIGYVGSTQKSEFAEGAHLHFEMYRDSQKVNPNELITFTEK